MCILAEHGDRAALAGEIAGIAAVGIGQKIDRCPGDLVICVIDQDTVVSGCSIRKDQVGGGITVIRTGRDPFRGRPEGGNLDKSGQRDFRKL